MIYLPGNKPEYASISTNDPYAKTKPESSHDWGPLGAIVLFSAMLIIFSLRPTALCCEKLHMSSSPSLSDRALPIMVSMAGICMTLLSLSLLIKAASLGVFLRQLLGFIGVIFVNSVILSYVALRISFSKNRDATLGEKVFVMALSVGTGVSLMIANTSGF